MRSWAFLLSGPIIWAVHFFALYIVASIWLSSPLARILTGLITLGCLLALALLLLAARRNRAGDAMERWSRAVLLAGLGIAGIAVLWQGLPALLI